MSSGRSRQGGGAGMKVIFFLPLLVIGLLLSVSLINVLFRDLKVFTWPKTDCSIVWSAVHASLSALRAAADAHRESGLRSVTGEHYEGGHWLAASRRIW